tara:strand:- start:25600 stop:27369 length:1770 start_codon:yes stop_codon:yes gene_type:complete
MADTLEKIGFKNFSTSDVAAGTAFDIATDANTAFVIKDILCEQSNTANPVELKATLAATSDISTYPTNIGTVASGAVSGMSGSLIIPPSHTFRVTPTVKSAAYWDMQFATWNHYQYGFFNNNARNFMQSSYNRTTVPTFGGSLEKTIKTTHYDNFAWSTATGSPWTDNFGNGSYTTSTYSNSYSWNENYGYQWMLFTTPTLNPSGTAGPNGGNNLFVGMGNSSYYNNHSIGTASDNSTNKLGQQGWHTQYYNIPSWDGEQLVFSGNYNNLYWWNLAEAKHYNFQGASGNYTYGIVQTNGADSGQGTRYLTSYGRTHFCNSSPTHGYYVTVSGHAGTNLKITASKVDKSAIIALGSATQTYTMAAGDFWTITDSSTNSNNGNPKTVCNTYSNGQAYDKWMTADWHSQASKLVIVIADVNGNQLNFLVVNHGERAPNNGRYATVEQLEEWFGWKSPIIETSGGVARIALGSGGSSSLVNNCSPSQPEGYVPNHYATYTMYLAENDLYLYCESNYGRIMKYDLTDADGAVEVIASKAKSAAGTNDVVGMDGQDHRETFHAIKTYPTTSVINSRSYTQGFSAHMSVYGIKESR